MSQTFHSFAALAAHLHAQDVEAAKRLKRVQHLPKPKIGPRTAGKKA